MILTLIPKGVRLIYEFFKCAFLMLFWYLMFYSILYRLKTMKEPNLTIPTFTKFVSDYPALLFPAYVVQSKIQRKVC